MTENVDRPAPTPEQAQEQLEQALFEIRRIIAGQDAMLERVLVCLLAQGHLLIEGVPGLAKTLTIKTTAGVLGGSFARVQFTPDLVPSDLVGTRIYRPQEGTFDTELGPVFCNFLLADEINRAPAKVQSALLEVMQERQVTIGHETHPVPSPFLVMATQNPIESEGTYPLPEAQIDRFLLKVLIGYPQHDEELTVVQRQLVDHPELKQVLSLEDLAALQRAVFDIYVDPSLVSYAVDIATATREPAAHGLPDLAQYISYGASPRGPISLVQGRTRSRSSAAASTRSWTTSRRSPTTRCATGSSSRTRRSRRRSRRTRSSIRCSPRCRRHSSTSRGRALRDGRVRNAGALLARPTPARPGPGPMAEGLLRARHLDRPPCRGPARGRLPLEPPRVGHGARHDAPYVPGDDVRRIDWASRRGPASRTCASTWPSACS